MAKKFNASDNEYLERLIRTGSMKQDIHRQIISVLGNDYLLPRRDTYFNGLAYSMRDRLIELWIKAQRIYYREQSKRVYYLSMEFLPGPLLMNYITSLKMKEECEMAIDDHDFSLEDLADEERDPGLGNGGLGRLASCYMDSIACLEIPGYGYGIRYDYGLFRQRIVNGFQVEECDNWLRNGSPFEIKHQGFLYTVHLYGRSESYTDDRGVLRFRWVDTYNVNAMACDILIPGYDNGNVNNMRLWIAHSSEEFNLAEFNKGGYIDAMEEKVLSENISKVLYPSDETEQGRELRLKQQYFFVAATFQDIFRRFKKEDLPYTKLPDLVAIQLNDTHPSIAIPELMRLLMDEEGLEWDEAWSICTRTFAYTNHTVMPEALETWPVHLMGRMLPRHLEIIYEINAKFLAEVAKRFPGDNGLLSRMSIIQEGGEKRVRMANLSIVASHHVNGVAALHSKILKETLFRDFDVFYPGKIMNVTNGISPRRWLLQANPDLADLITATIGSNWVTHLDDLKKLIPLAEDEEFRKAWDIVKGKRKRKLSDYIERTLGLKVSDSSLFDIQVKRMHEYKRQLLNLMHVITLYNRLCDGKTKGIMPRTVIFGGKAAPGYFMAKLIIKLINSVADKVNGDPKTRDLLRVVFIPNYSVSLAEKIIPAADLSEQISTAGYEASGTGNMKFALNGALTIGTLDGANVEIMEEVGLDNIFIFGLKVEDIEKLYSQGYYSREYYNRDEDLRRVIDMIDSGFFSPEDPGLFRPIVHSLLYHGDRFLVCADYRSYIEAQDRVSQLFRDRAVWTKKSILNTANMGKFSSDRAVMEYAEKIWKVKQVDV